MIDSIDTASNTGEEPSSSQLRCAAPVLERNKRVHDYEGSPCIALLAFALHRTGAIAHLLGQGRWRIEVDPVRIDLIDGEYWRDAAATLDMLARSGDPAKYLRWEEYVEVLEAPGPGSLVLSRGRERPRYFRAPAREEGQW